MTVKSRPDQMQPNQIQIAGSGYIRHVKKITLIKNITIKTKRTADAVIRF